MFIVYLLLTATQYSACHPVNQKSQSLGDSCNVKRCSATTSFHMNFSGHVTIFS